MPLHILCPMPGVLSSFLPAYPASYSLTSFKFHLFWTGFAVSPLPLVEMSNTRLVWSSTASAQSPCCPSSAGRSDFDREVGWAPIYFHLANLSSTRGKNSVHLCHCLPRAQCRAWSGSPKQPNKCSVCKREASATQSERRRSGQ